MLDPTALAKLPEFLVDPVRGGLSDAMHDVFLVMVDSAFAFELPRLSAGWIEGSDVETGRTHIISSADLQRLPDRVRNWQDTVEQDARDRGLEVLRLDGGQHFHDTLVSFLLSRKQLRR